MEIISIKHNDKLCDHGVVVLLFSGFILWVLRGQGVLPSIMADEWHYSLLSRLLPLSQSNDPGFAYLILFRATNFCSGGYLNCARVLNSLFFISACLLIHLVNRKFLSSSSTLITLALVLLMPESVYTIFFMPEAAYYFAFWLFTYFVLTQLVKGNYEYWVVATCGLCLAFASLIKPHALFLLACFCLFLLVAPVEQSSHTFRRRIFLSVVAVSTFFATKFTLGYLAAGDLGITLFGSRYSSMASQNITMSRIIDLLFAALYILINHSALIVFLLFVPVFAALSYLSVSLEGRHRAGGEVRSLAYFSFALLIPMLGVTAIFSASVVGTNPYDVINRMHMRYYSFILPLFIIFAALIAWGNKSISSTFQVRTWTKMICVPLLLAGAWRVGFASNELQVNVVDSPALLFLTSGKIIRAGLMLIGVGVAIVSLFNMQLAARLFLLLFLPLISITNTYIIQQEIEVRKKPDVYDLAGIVVGGLIAERPNEQVTIVGSDEALLYKTSFFLDRQNSAIRIIQSESSIDPVSIPIEATRVIVFGEGKLNKPGFELTLDENFKLYSLCGESCRMIK